MAERLPIRQAPAGDAASPAIADLRRQLEEQRYVDLRATRGQAFAATGPRVFKVDEPKTDVLELKAGEPNVIPHGLGCPAKHVVFTFMGNARGWLEEAPPAGFDAAQVVSLRVSSDVSARVRVR